MEKKEKKAITEKRVTPAKSVTSRFALKRDKILGFDETSRRIVVYDPKIESGMPIQESGFRIVEDVRVFESDGVGRVWMLTPDKMIVADQDLRHVVSSKQLDTHSFAKLAVNKKGSTVILIIVQDNALDIRIFNSSRGGIKQIMRIIHTEFSRVDWLSVSPCQLNQHDFFISIATQDNDSVIRLRKNELQIRNLSKFSLPAGIPRMTSEPGNPIVQVLSLITDGQLLLLRENGYLCAIKLIESESIGDASDKLTELRVSVERSEKTTYFQIERASDKKDLLTVYDNVQHMFGWCMYNRSTEDKSMIDIKIKYKMTLKRFDRYRLMCRCVVMISEYWDLWIISG